MLYKFPAVHPFRTAVAGSPKDQTEEPRQSAAKEIVSSHLCEYAAREGPCPVAWTAINERGQMEGFCTCKYFDDLGYCVDVLALSLARERLRRRGLGESATLYIDFEDCVVRIMEGNAEEIHPQGAYNRRCVNVDVVRPAEEKSPPRRHTTIHDRVAAIGDGPITEVYFDGARRRARCRNCADFHLYGRCDHTWMAALKHASLNDLSDPPTFRLYFDAKTPARRQTPLMVVTGCRASNVR